MLRSLGWLAALCLPVLWLVGPVLAFADKEKEKDKDAEKEKWVTVTKIQAKVSAVYEDKRKLRIQITVPKLDLNQVQALANARAAMAQARDVNALRQAQQQMAQAQARLYTTENKDLDVQAIDDVVVRSLHPRQEFDDKGRLKKLTKEELKEAKGEGELAKLPGYKAEFSDVQTEQIVQLTVVRKKNSPAPKAKPKPVGIKGKGKDMDADLDALAEDSTPQVSFIMIVATPMAK